ncbi:hypothetical protein ADUPG1_000421 [Aduncisulcus paluster]|uniref:CST complex subunit CTC1 n=1 Tax=Aduncisulcus paluster TaxID=2918883 RepID=A0ABQ5K695_9EUKA|nr:hypothetical protein ADUPG1_000421 [Aduncisulcus paluster]
MTFLSALTGEPVWLPLSSTWGVFLCPTHDEIVAISSSITPDSLLSLNPMSIIDLCYIPKGMSVKNSSKSIKFRNHRIVNISFCLASSLSTKKQLNIGGIFVSVLLESTLEPKYKRKNYKKPKDLKLFHISLRSHDSVRTHEVFLKIGKGLPSQKEFLSNIYTHILQPSLSAIILAGERVNYFDLEVMTSLPHIRNDNIHYTIEFSLPIGRISSLLVIEQIPIFPIKKIHQSPFLILFEPHITDIDGNIVEGDDIVRSDSPLVVPPVASVWTLGRITGARLVTDGMFVAPDKVISNDKWTVVSTFLLPLFPHKGICRRQSCELPHAIHDPIHIESSKGTARSGTTKESSSTLPSTKHTSTPNPKDKSSSSHIIFPPSISVHGTFIAVCSSSCVKVWSVDISLLRGLPNESSDMFDKQSVSCVTQHTLTYHGEGKGKKVLTRSGYHNLSMQEMSPDHPSTSSRALNASDASYIEGVDDESVIKPDISHETSLLSHGRSVVSLFADGNTNTVTVTVCHNGFLYSHTHSHVATPLKEQKLEKYGKLDRDSMKKEGDKMDKWAMVEFQNECTNGSVKIRHAIVGRCRYLMTIDMQPAASHFPTPHAICLFSSMNSQLNNRDITSQTSPMLFIRQYVICKFKPSSVFAAISALPLYSSENTAYLKPLISSFVGSISHPSLLPLARSPSLCVCCPMNATGVSSSSSSSFSHSAISFDVLKTYIYATCSHFYHPSLCVCCPMNATGVSSSSSSSFSHSAISFDVLKTYIYATCSHFYQLTPGTIIAVTKNSIESLSSQTTSKIRSPPLTKASKTAMSSNRHAEILSSSASKGMWVCRKKQGKNGSTDLLPLSFIPFSDSMIPQAPLLIQNKLWWIDGGSVWCMYANRDRHLSKKKRQATSSYSEETSPSSMYHRISLISSITIPHVRCVYTALSSHHPKIVPCDSGMMVIDCGHHPRVYSMSSLGQIRPKADSTIGLFGMIDVISALNVNVSISQSAYTSAMVIECVPRKHKHHSMEKEFCTTKEDIEDISEMAHRDSQFKCCLLICKFGVFNIDDFNSSSSSSSSFLSLPCQSCFTGKLSVFPCFRDTANRSISLVTKRIRHFDIPCIRLSHVKEGEGTKSSGIHHMGCSMCSISPPLSSTSSSLCEVAEFMSKECLSMLIPLFSLLFSSTVSAFSSISSSLLSYLTSLALMVTSVEERIRDIKGIVGLSVTDNKVENNAKKHQLAKILQYLPFRGLRSLPPSTRGSSRLSVRLFGRTFGLNSVSKALESVKRSSSDHTDAERAGAERDVGKPLGMEGNGYLQESHSSSSHLSSSVSASLLLPQARAGLLLPSTRILMPSVAGIACEEVEIFERKRKEEEEKKKKEEARRLQMLQMRRKRLMLQQKKEREDKERVSNSSKTEPSAADKALYEKVKKLPAHLRKKYAHLLKKFETNAGVDEGKKEGEEKKREEAEKKRKEEERGDDKSISSPSSSSSSSSSPSSSSSSSSVNDNVVSIAITFSAVSSVVA